MAKRLPVRIVKMLRIRIRVILGSWIRIPKSKFWGCGGSELSHEGHRPSHEGVEAQNIAVEGLKTRGRITFLRRRRIRIRITVKSLIRNTAFLARLADGRRGSRSQKKDEGTISIAIPILTITSNTLIMFIKS
jgi:hypothetical protein